MQTGLQKTWIILCLGLVLAGWTAGAAWATTVRIANLRDLETHARRIFVGRCLSIGHGRVGDLTYTAYTFQVLDAVRGVRGKTVVVRQLGGATAPAAGDGRVDALQIAGIPSYQPGQEVLLFLTAESPIGLSSPIGLAQGVFQVRDHGDSRSVANALGNRNLTRGLPAGWLRARGLSNEEAARLQEEPPESLDYDFFLQVLRKIGRTEP